MKVNKNYNLPLEKTEIATLYKNGVSVKDIAKMCGCHISNIYSHLRRLKIERRTASQAARKWVINEDFFNKVDTQEKAYFLGLLYADGYNQENKNQIRLTLNSKDEDIIFKINNIVGYNKPVSYITNVNSYSGKEQKLVDLTINSKKMSRDLAKLGCPQKKTFIITFPSFLHENLYSHFIRGYFDGDGCISPKEYQFTMVGTYLFLAEVQKILVKLCNVNFTKLSRDERTEIYTLRYKGKNNCIKILDYLYKDSSIHLDRKYNIYKSIAA